MPKLALGILILCSVSVLAEGCALSPQITNTPRSLAVMIFWEQDEFSDAIGHALRRAAEPARAKPPACTARQLLFGKDGKVVDV